jgi:hypothetical protein
MGDPATRNTCSALGARIAVVKSWRDILEMGRFSDLMYWEPNIPAARGFIWFSLKTLTPLTKVRVVAPAGIPSNTRARMAMVR